MVTRKTASKTTSKTASRTSSARTAKTATKEGSKPAATGAAKRAVSPTKPGATPAMPAATAAPAPGGQRKSLAPAVQAPTGEERYRWIAHAAYLRAEKRGFEPGREIDDWLAAEAEFAAVFTTG